MQITFCNGKHLKNANQFFFLLLLFYGKYMILTYFCGRWKLSETQICASPEMSFTCVPISVIDKLII